jgi:hypothetical protein
VCKTSGFSVSLAVFYQRVESPVEPVLQFGGPDDFISDPEPFFAHAFEKGQVPSLVFPAACDRPE